MFKINMVVFLANMFNKLRVAVGKVLSFACELAYDIAGNGGVLRTILSIAVYVVLTVIGVALCLGGVLFGIAFVFSIPVATIYFGVNLGLAPLFDAVEPISILQAIGLLLVVMFIRTYFIYRP